MTQNVSELLRLLRQRPQPEIETQKEQEAVTSLQNTMLDEVEVAPSTPLPLTQALLTQDKPIQPLPSYRLASIPVDQILIDPRQPRRTLPDDLRDACAQGRLNLRNALGELCRRAQASDTVASLRVKQLRELADNIGEVGLQYPPKVTTVRAKDGTVKYQIVDGERRFWAWLLLLAAADESERVYRESIPAMVEDDRASPEDILRSQWGTNLYRERVPVVDIADYVLAIRDAYASRLQLNPQPWLSSLGADAEAMSVPLAILTLTGREIAATMGKRMSRSTLFRYVAIAEKMRADAKAIARVRQFGLRQCEWLSRLSPAQQLDAARRMKPTDDEGESESVEADEVGRARTGAGRPRLLDGRITLLVRVAGELSRDKETQFNIADPTKLQELRHATTDAIDVLQRYVRLIDHRLNAGASNATSDA
jgi:hypothetical protein